MSSEKILFSMEVTPENMEKFKEEIENPNSRLNRWASLVEDGHDPELITGLLKTRAEELNEDTRKRN